MTAKPPKWTIAAPVFAGAVLLAATLHFNMGGFLIAGADAAALARDTVFAAVMIILNGIIGLEGRRSIWALPKPRFFARFCCRTCDRRCW